MLKGKGFYAALALCLVGAGTAAWVVVDKTLGSITAPAEPIASSSASEEASWGFPDLEEAEKVKPDIQMESGSSSSQSIASSSPEPSSDAGEVYEPQALALEPQTSVFVLPVESAEVFNQYSAGELVKNTTLDKWCTHDGIDFSAEEGTEVFSVSAGTVTRVYDNGIWGRTVEVDHGNQLTSIYSGLSKDVLVSTGDTVAARQALGKVGNTNLAEAKLESHLHFAMKQNDKFVNPLETMGQI